MHLARATRYCFTKTCFTGIAQRSSIFSARNVLVCRWITTKPPMVSFESSSQGSKKPHHNTKKVSENDEILQTLEDLSEKDKKKKEQDVKEDKDCENKMCASVILGMTFSGVFMWEIHKDLCHDDLFSDMPPIVRRLVKTTIVLVCLTTSYGIGSYIGGTFPVAGIAIPAIYVFSVFACNMVQ